MINLWLIGINLFTLVIMKKDSGPEQITINSAEIIYTMRGGMGASWHALSKEISLNNHLYQFPAREYCPRGSAYGGNPPVTDESGWNQIKNHASWLGLNFIRVELSQGMYEPRRNEFEWDNEEMQALYLILDWCEKNQVDVFLQQMWSDVAWNAWPGVHPLISAPYRLDDFAHGLATLLDYLIKNKKYTCIKYFCMTNEPPGGPWGYWWEYGHGQGSLAETWKRLKQEFDFRGISVPISGPDWTSMPPFEPEKLTFAQDLGSIDIHSYDGVTAAGEQNLRCWANWAHAQNKPFFLSEYGNMQLGYGDDHPGQATFAAALSNAQDVLRGMRAGVDGFNRWSFTNRGDLDGQWQLIRTWNRDTKDYYQIIEPETEAYYGFGIISRFLSKYSAVLTCRHEFKDETMLAGALKSPQSKLSVFLLNISAETLHVKLHLVPESDRPLYIYQVSESILAEPKFQLNPWPQPIQTEARLILPAKSITTVTNYFLSHQDRGIILE